MWASKAGMFLGTVVLALLALAASAVPQHYVVLAQQLTAEQSKDRTITQVVKLLQDLLEQSKTEGDTERTLYGKYKCYCDTNEAAKKAKIEKLTQEIGLLESHIAELKASSAELSVAVAKLDKDMAENKASREQATAIRAKEKEAFDATEADLTQAIEQMRQAIEILAGIGADQTLGNAAADHTRYMAGHEVELAAVGKSVKKAMLAAMAFASEKQAHTLSAFLQAKAPFTATYTAQSGEVVGILKDMRDTFTANLETARVQEAKAVEAYNKYMQTMLEAYNEMEASFLSKQGQLSSNDSVLADKKTQLETAQLQLAEAQEFLASLLEMCAAKKKQYDERVTMRTSEQTAISEAIAILNSDASFDTFGKVAATSTGSVSLFQRVQIRRHRFSSALAAMKAKAEEDQRSKTIKFLESKSHSKESQSLFGRVASMLKAHNPFAVVLEEIEKIIALIGEEETADTNKKAWCDSEREKTNTDISTKEGELVTLKGAIDELIAAIEDPEVGLKVSIANSEEALSNNIESQGTETKERKEDNTQYQKNISHLQEAQALLQKAITVLTKYYAKFKGEFMGDFLQKDKPSPPPTWEDEYKGQSEGGTSAITMLEYILSETKKEETVAHDTELSAQHDFEDSMIALKDEEKTLQGSIASLKVALAEKEKTLLEKKDDYAMTEEEIASLEAYLAKIKPGCDFMDENIEQRRSNRAEEKTALESAVTFLKATPAYKEAMEAAHQESLGDCQGICAEAGEGDVKCKACLAKTSVPGYCAGHPSTSGC